MNSTNRRYARRNQERDPRKRRIIAAIATVGAFGALIAVTQVSLANTQARRHHASCPPATATAAPGGDASASAGSTGGTGGAATAPASPAADASGAAKADTANSGSATGGATSVPRNGMNPTGAPYKDHGAVQHPGDGQEAGSATGTRSGRTGNCAPSSGASAPAAGSSSGASAAPLEVLANNCDNSKFPPHDGFQNGDRCVTTEFGEVGNAANNPTLLITSAPRSVRTGQTFTIKVSTRNLVRDRFLAAGKGGYYKESSLLTADGLVRGHFHTACRMLATTNSAPAADPVPDFFVATEDSKGGATPDEVTITVPGLTKQGLAQCAVWAGDGSHRIPMMQRANQIPAFDSVRLTVR
ncbi:Pecanex-like protein 1 [Plantactinospora siamensis]|uniref:Pecanex-like protein 1 n=1 Tax=Plantactinospora siamensis TaxID=555372 RepID=A0ABV6NS97_9ACTN